METSRSARKREMQQLERLAVALVELPARLHSLLPCPEEIREQLGRAQTMKGGARQRQIKYVTKLLQAEADQDALYRFLDQHQGRTLAEAKRQHLLERWRDALIDEALTRAEEGNGVLPEQWRSAVLDEVQGDLPCLDRNALERLACRFARTRDPRASREIFRVFKAALEEKERGESVA